MKRFEIGTLGVILDKESDLDLIRDILKEFNYREDSYSKNDKKIKSLVIYTYASNKPKNNFYIVYEFEHPFCTKEINSTKFIQKYKKNSILIFKNKCLQLWKMIRSLKNLSIKKTDGLYLK